MSERAISLNNTGERAAWRARFLARPTVLYIGAGVLLLVFLLHGWVVNYRVDDAFITFRYVKNFVAGQGLVYNPGERVEGYTNFLWTVLLSAFVWAFRGVDLPLLAQVLGMAFGAATIALVIRFSWRLHGRATWFGLMAAAFLALNGPFIAWSTGGLETPLYAFLLFAAAYAYVNWLATGKRFLLAPFLFALATLARPDGLLFFAATGIHLLATEALRARGSRQSPPGRQDGKSTGKREEAGRQVGGTETGSRAWRFNSWGAIAGRLLLWGLAFAVILVPYFLWRYSYYGWLLPNTFYAKVGSGAQQYLRGVQYLWSYAISYRAFVLVLPLALILRVRAERWVAYFGALMAVYLLYVIYVGGDGLAFYRFIAAVAPFLYLLAQEGLYTLYLAIRERMPVLPERWLVASSLVVLAAGLVYDVRPTLDTLLFPASQRWHEPQSELTFPVTSDGTAYYWFDDYFIDRQRLAAEWLQAHARPGALVASTPAGSISYYMDLPVIDMLGLADEHIAHSAGTYGGEAGAGRAGHEKGDGAYVLSRAPDYILLGNVAVLPFPISEAQYPSKLVLKSEHEIWDSPQFHAQYELVNVRLSDHGVFQYFSFYRKRGTAFVLLSGESSETSFHEQITK